MRPLIFLLILGLGPQAFCELTPAEQNLENDIQKFNQQYLNNQTGQAYVVDYNQDPNSPAATTQFNSVEATEIAGINGATQKYEACLAQCAQANVAVAAYQRSSVCAASCAQQFPADIPGNQCYRSGSNVPQTCVHAASQ